MYITFFPREMPGDIIPVRMEKQSDKDPLFLSWLLSRPFHKFSNHALDIFDKGL